MNYKMVTCDLDGTLLGSDDHVSAQNNSAIKEFCKKGIPFVPCTGRTLSEMKEVYDNPDIRYIIYSNGAGIIDKKTGERINNCFDIETKKKLISLFGSYDFFPFIHADGKSLVNGNLSGKEKEYKLCDAVAFIAENVSEKTYELEKDLLSMDVECITVFFKTEAEYEKCRMELSGHEDIILAFPWERNIEMFNKRAGKGKAAEMLAKKLGIDMSEVIAIGDSNNDAVVLDAAGLGIAVSNGSEEIKKIADVVACSNDEHVAEFVLKNYFS